MPAIATYARYSTDLQRPTSIEDQLSRCHRLAAHKGLTISPALVFSDSAVTGKANGLQKRDGYRRLLDAIEAGQVDVLIVDELSRLSRHMTEGARLMDLVEERGLRVLTSDGLDTDLKGWKPIWALKMLQATQEVDSTADRSMRGTYYQLERGYATAMAPYGYRIEHEVSPSGRRLGARWVIDEEKAAVMREIFEYRRDGLSLFAITNRLNKAGIPPPAVNRCKRPSKSWRPTSIHRMLRNPIYRGIYVWHGSEPTRIRARRRRKPLETRDFARPECRIVSDDLWKAANNVHPVPRAKPRAPHGSARTIIAGLLDCTTCSNRLTVTGSGRWKVVGCQTCRDEVSLGRRASWTGYTSLRSVLAALSWAIEALFTGKVLDEFHRRLKAQMQAGPTAEVERARQRLRDIDVKLDRVKTLTMNPSIGLETLEREMQMLVEGRREAAAEVERLQVRTGRMSKEQLDTMLRTDPREMLQSLLRSESEVWKARATLRRLVKLFSFVERVRKGVSIFEITLLPDAAVTEAAGIERVGPSQEVSFRIKVTTRLRVADGEIVTGKRIKR